MRMRGILSLTALCFLVACQQGPTADQMSEQGREPMSGKELRQTMVGNTLYQTGYTQSTKWQWAGYYAPGGEARGRAWWSGGKNEGTGTWEIEGNRWCTEWSVDEWGEGERNCMHFFRSGDKIDYVIVSGPTDNGTSTLKQGNPHDL